MLNIKSCIVAMALVASTATAQTSQPSSSELFGVTQTNSSELFRQMPPPDVPAPTTTRKPVISNTSAGSSAADLPAASAAADRSPNAVRNLPAGLTQGREGPNEFQKFIADNGGRILPIFGSEFFANTPSTFAPISNSPVPSDYPLGPGDELLIRGWGTIDIDYHATIDRNGTISIPTVGTVVLAGVKAGEAETVIRSAVGKLYKGVTISVTFGQLRAITVYVVGQAKRPGTYTISSLSTLVTALFASGGPNSNGSMRRVQVKRGGKVAAELDLYAFIGKGDKSADIKLLDGDTIYIPPAGGYVALVGQVNSPAIYELKTDADTIGSLVEFAGGLPVVADPRRAYLERIDAGKDHPRTVVEFPLDREGLNRTLRRGDLLNIISIAPDFANAVVLRGNVDQPVRAPFKPGMRVSDLIPSRDYLMTRSSIRRQNNAVESGAIDKNTSENADTIAARIGNLIDEVNWDYAVVERVNRKDLSVSLIAFNLGNIFKNANGPDNVLLQPGDTVTIFSQNDVSVPMVKRQIFVRIEGEVNVPGVYQMSPGDTLQSLLVKAGGATPNAYLFGSAFYRESVRGEQQANLELAADKLENQIRNAQAKSIANTRVTVSTDAAIMAAQDEQQMMLAKQAVDRLRRMRATGRIAFGLDPSERSFAHLPQLKLENGDRFVIPARPAFVHVFGAVNAAAAPLWKPNSRVSDYLKNAGLTADADTDNIFIMRADGSVSAAASSGWFFGGIGGIDVMPGDAIVVPEKVDRETGWSKFMQGTREWAQIFANFGLGAAALKTLRN